MADSRAYADNIQDESGISSFVRKKYFLLKKSHSNRSQVEGAPTGQIRILPSKSLTAIINYLKNCNL